MADTQAPGPAVSGTGVEPAIDAGPRLGTRLPVPSLGLEVVDGARCLRRRTGSRLRGLFRARLGGLFWRRRGRSSGRPWAFALVAADRLVDEVHKQGPDLAVRSVVRMSVVIVHAALTAQKAVTPGQVAEEVEGEDVEVACQKLIGPEPVGERARPRRFRGVACARHLRRWRDDDEDPVRVLVHPVADGQVVGLILVQLIVVADVAGRIA